MPAELPPWLTHDPIYGELEKRFDSGIPFSLVENLGECGPV